MPLENSKNSNQNKITFMALGGLAEVGKNMYAIEVEDDIFIVDCGVLFPDESLPGIDYVIPSFQYLIENKERIRGLFITHGHEDHIGAIPFLLKQLDIPGIYAAGIAYDLILSKLEEHNIKKRIIKYSTNSVYTFPSAEVSFVLLNHSIPDMHGIAIKTKLGYIFHTGDFKIDYTPVGPKAEYDKLVKMGKEGMLVLFSDSTNAIKKDIIASEKTIGKSINQLFQRIKGRIIIATFASNLYRVKQIVEAAVFTKRKIAILGRSMQKVVDIAIQANYITLAKSAFVSASHIEKTPPEQLVVLCTGTQGEPLAALSRIATGNHKYIQASPRDTVILSSSVIPGNHVAINQTINLLYKKGASVITDGPLADIHASGHGSQQDLKLMLTLTKSKYFVPIHGEHRMLKTHKRLAVDVGIDENNVFVLDNGEMLEINQNGAEVVKKLPCFSQYMDRLGYAVITNNIIRERRMLSEEGFFLVMLTIDSKHNKLVSDPIIMSRGFIYMKEAESFVQTLSNKVKSLVGRELANNTNLGNNKLRDQIYEMLQTELFKETNRNPVIVPIIHLV